jgi:hypothetical protein
VASTWGLFSASSITISAIGTPLVALRVPIAPGCTEYGSRYQLSLSNQKLKALDNERSLLYLNLGNLIQSGLEWHKTLISLIRLIKENLGFHDVACLKFDSEMQQLGKPILVEGDEGFKSRVQALEILDLREAQFLRLIEDGESVLLKETTHSELLGEMSLAAPQSRPCLIHVRTEDSLRASRVCDNETEENENALAS